MTDSTTNHTRPSTGFTLLEVLVASSIALIVALTAYTMMDWSRRAFVAQTDAATAKSIGRSVVDIVGSDVRAAGYNPRGVSFNGMPQALPSRIRVLADSDGDGIVGTAAEPGEDITYLFEGPDARGRYVIHRGADLNGDGDFDDLDESSDELTGNIEPIDFDQDGTPDPLLAYDAPTPDTSVVTLTFGVRAQHRDIQKRETPIFPIQSKLRIRNR